MIKTSGAANGASQGSISEETYPEANKNIYKPKIKWIKPN